MNVSLEEMPAANKNVPMRELVATLQQTMARNHQKILAAALNDWQRKYAGRDPSDACASVHVAAAPKRARKAAPSFQKLVRRARNGSGGKPGRD